MLKSPEKVPIKKIKPRNLEYHLDQPGDGKRLTFSEAPAFIGRKRAVDQSLVNCNKSVSGGGFNPSSPEEIEEVYGSKKPEQRSNSNR